MLTTLVRAQIVTIPDANFKNALVNTSCVDFDGNGSVDGDVDTNNDGEIQFSEAEAVVFGLYVRDRNISSLLGIESFIYLERLECSSNSLSSLNISDNTNLNWIDCSYNNILNLDVTQNPDLINLRFHNNAISDIDISNNPNLEIFYCYNNDLISLDLSLKPNLIYLDCFNNQLNYLNIKNGNNTNILRMLADGNPNLECVEVDDVVFSNSNPWWRIDTTAYYSENCELGIEESFYGSLKIYPNPTKNIVNIGNYSGHLIKSIKIFDIIGNSVYAEKVNFEQINLANWTNGLYIVLIETTKNTLSFKVIKE